MKKLEVKDLKENFFEAIGKEWMLVTAGTKEKFNTMTASWGGIGWLWNKPVAFVFIRPERYTYEFVEKNDHLTLSFLGEENKKIHAVCGSKSGRNIDKVKETGLKPVFTENGNVLGVGGAKGGGTKKNGHFGYKMVINRGGLCVFI